MNRIGSTIIGPESRVDVANSPAGIYMLKVKNKNTRTRGEICSNLTIKTLEHRLDVFIVNFEHISHLVLVFQLLTLNM